MKTFIYATLFVSVLFIISCNNNHYDKAEANNILDSTATNDIKTDSIKLIKTGYINLKVVNTSKVIEKINALSKSFGGMITHENLESNLQNTTEHKISNDSLMIISSYTPRADVIVKLPSGKLFDFLDSINYMSSFIVQTSMDIEDKSLQYLENQLKEKSRINLLNKINSKKLHTDGMLFSVEKADEIVDHEIENKEIDDKVAYSNVKLNIFQDAQIKKEIVANYNTSDYQTPISNRISIAFQDGWSFFMEIVLLILRLWAFVLIGILVIIALKYKKIGYLKK